MDMDYKYGFHGFFKYFCARWLLKPLLTYLKSTIGTQDVK